MDYRIELINIPVSDVDRSKAFYAAIGFNLDHDHQVTDELRFVQLTPPGSPCSIAMGTGMPQGEPGSVKGMQIVVDSIETAHAELGAAGAEVSDIEDLPWGSFVHFRDPDGNAWAVQQTPGRGQ